MALTKTYFQGACTRLFSQAKRVDNNNDKDAQSGNKTDYRRDKQNSRGTKKRQL